MSDSKKGKSITPKKPSINRSLPKVDLSPAIQPIEGTTEEENEEDDLVEPLPFDDENIEDPQEHYLDDEHISPGRLDDIKLLPSEIRISPPRFRPRSVKHHPARRVELRPVAKRTETVKLSKKDLTPVPKNKSLGNRASRNMRKPPSMRQDRPPLEPPNIEETNDPLIVPESEDEPIEKEKKKNIIPIGRI